jgi:Kef-type K+ transport system membrane component KefB
LKCVVWVRWRATTKIRLFNDYSNLDARTKWDTHKSMHERRFRLGRSILHSHSEQKPEHIDLADGVKQSAYDSSTALVAKMLYERGSFSESSKRMMMSALVIEEILAVVIVSLMPGPATGGSVIAAGISGWALRGALLIALVIISGFYVGPRLIDRISQLDLDVAEAGFLLSIGLGFAMAVLSSLLGFSTATGAFLMGLMIRGKRARFVYGKVRPVRDLFLVIFFVSMGMLVDPSEFLNAAIVLPLVGLALVGKYAGAYVGALLVSHRSAAHDIAVAMAPREEFSFIIAREASSTGAARALIYPIAGTVVLTTTLFSALAQISRKGGIELRAIEKTGNQMRRLSVETKQAIHML